VKRDNGAIAAVLEQIAELLEVQAADPFRVRAYRAAAESVRQSPRPVAEIDEQGGARALEELPHVGKHLASLIQEIAHTGGSATLERLRGAVSPEDLFMTLPGIGERLASRLHAELGVETLEELELAAHDGRLSRVSGFGARRARALADLLSVRLSRSPRRAARILPEAPAHEPPALALLLAIDREYRERAEAGTLPTIAPRRMNPEHAAWLPVFHTERGGFHFTALYSNTARAHALHKTRDWVILYYSRDGDDGQCTVVTESRGPRAGQRVVRGREAELGSHS